MSLLATIAKLILGALFAELRKGLLEALDKFLLRKTAEALGAEKAANDANATAAETKEKMDKAGDKEVTTDDLLDALDSGKF